MKPPIDTIRLTSSERELLVRVKKKTGIESWNVLCRWSLILGLSEKMLPMRKSVEKRDAVEIKWDTFSGKWSDVLSAAIQLRYHANTKFVPELTVFDFIHSRLEDGVRKLTKATAENELRAFKALLSAISE